MLSSLIGIIASSGGAAAANSYESIATTTLPSSTSIVTFSSIPSTYKHLQVRWIARSDRASFADYFKVTFNADTGSNYSWHYVQGNGSTAATNNSTSSGLTSFILNRAAPGAGQNSNVFGAGVIDVLDYADTNKYKTTRTLGGFDDNSVGEISLQSGNWRSTSAVTSLTLTIGAGVNFVQYSSFALYGIKG
jgi:hypothetical protein